MLRGISEKTQPESERLLVVADEYAFTEDNNDSLADRSGVCNAMIKLKLARGRERIADTANREQRTR